MGVAVVFSGDEGGCLGWGWENEEEKEKEKKEKGKWMARSHSVSV